MAGFRSVKKYAEAWEAGRTFTGYSRDYTATTFNTSPFLDLSTVGGGPPANYYASTPLTSAVLDGTTGIYYGDNKAPARRYLTHWSLTGQTAGWAGQYYLQDILLYYPFFDGDDLTTQTAINTVSLPRYTSGDGVKVYPVCQSTPAGNGSFIFTYVNQNGVTRVSPTNFVALSAATPGQSMVASPVATSGSNIAYAVLAEGDTGVRSIVDVTVLSTIGGLFGMVLAYPIASMMLPEGACEAHQELITMKAPPPRIYDGAYLGLLARLSNTVVGSALLGSYNFIWDEGT